MKNRKSLYLLLPLVLVIWGLIFFRIMDHLDKPADISASGIDPFKAKSANPVLDTVILEANYSDPFLDRKMLIGRSDAGSVFTSITNAPASSSRKQEVVWPQIRYGGSIRNQKNKSPLYLIQIENKNYLMKIGESKDNIKLVKVFSDSILVRFNKYQKAIPKERL